MEIERLPERLNWAPGIVDYSPWEKWGNWIMTTGTPCLKSRYYTEIYCNTKTGGSFYVSYCNSSVLPKIVRDEVKTRAALDELIAFEIQKGSGWQINPDEVVAEEMPHALADVYGSGRFAAIRVNYNPPDKGNILAGHFFAYIPIGPRIKRQFLEITKAAKGEARSDGDNAIIEALKKFDDDEEIPERMLSKSPGDFFFPTLTARIGGPGGGTDLQRMC